MDRCWCGYQPTSARDQFLHEANRHTKAGKITGPDGWSTSRAPAPAQRRRGRVKHRKISEVGTTTSAGLACPVCGGTDYNVKRSLKAKLMLGLASLVIKASQVRCVTCGTVYQRG